MGSGCFFGWGSNASKKRVNMREGKGKIFTLFLRALSGEKQRLRGWGENHRSVGEHWRGGRKYVCEANRFFCLKVLKS